MFFLLNRLNTDALNHDQVILKTFVQKQRSCQGQNLALIGLCVPYSLDSGEHNTDGFNHDQAVSPIRSSMARRV